MARILFIDDDPLIVELVEEMLRNEGHEVMGTPSPQEALRAHRNDQADLVITDIMMPDRNGITTAMGFRSFDPWVPLMVISGSSVVDTPEYQETVQTLRISLTLKKPFTMSELHDSVQQALSTKPAEESPACDFDIQKMKLRRNTLEMRLLDRYLQEFDED